MTVESISPHLLDNIERITDEPAKKVFRRTNLAQDDWTLALIVLALGLVAVRARR